MLPEFDTTSLLEKLDLVKLAGADVTLTKPSDESGFVHGKCPWCGGRDRFKVWPEEQRFFCWHCRRKGDALQYIQYRRNLSFVNACKLVQDGEIVTDVTPAPIKPAAEKKERPPFDYDLWRYRLEPMVSNACLHLYTEASDGARAAVSWLISRGIGKADIALYGLGYNPEWKNLYGDYRLPPGLLIPRWAPVNEQPIAAVNVYVSRQWHEKYGKRRFLKGSDPKVLFNGHRVKDAETVFVTEGELDCILLNRFLSPMPYPTIAITAGGVRIIPDDLSLLDGKRVILAFDNDEAGRQGAADWLDRLPGATVAPALPDGQDITDWYKAGGDLAAWAETAVK